MANSIKPKQPVINSQAVKVLHVCFDLLYSIFGMQREHGKFDMTMIFFPFYMSSHETIKTIFICCKG